jgi:hypothetical protein
MIIVLGCQPNLKLTDQKKDSIVQEVKETSRQFWVVNNQKYDSGSLEKFMSFIDEQADQSWVTDPAITIFNINLFRSRADLENVWREMLMIRSSTNVTLLNQFFSVLSATQVLEVNEGDYTLTGTDGKIYGPYRMVNTIVWVNRNGQWKMLHCHESWANKKED